MSHERIGHIDGPLMVVILKLDQDVWQVSGVVDAAAEAAAPVLLPAGSSSLVRPKLNLAIMLALMMLRMVLIHLHHFDSHALVSQTIFSRRLLSRSLHTSFHDTKREQNTMTDLES